MGEQSIQVLRAAVARTKQELDEAEHAQAKVESDLVIAKARLTDVANRMAAGTSVAEDLVSVAARVKELEAARAQAEGRPLCQ